MPNRVTKKVAQKTSATSTPSRIVGAKDRQAPLMIPQGKLGLFHGMVDRIGDEVMVVDKRSRIVFVNRAAMRGLGYPKNKILGRSFMDFLNVKMSLTQWQNSYFLEIKRRKRPVSYSVQRTSERGKTRMIDMTVAYMPYRSEDYVLAVGRDITEQLAYQRKLKESEDRYRMLSEQAAEGIVMIDLSGHIIYANRSAAKMFKTNVSDLMGSHFENHVDKPSLPTAWQYFKKVKGGTPIRQGEIEIKDKKGRLIPVEFTAFPIIRDGHVEQIHVIFRDIREKKEMENLLRETAKKEAFQHFIAGTTHEIQQPLKGLLEYSQRLIDRYKGRDFEYIGFKEFNDIMKMLQVMNDQVKYCCDTTDRLNILNRRKAKLYDTHCDVNHIIRESVNMFKHSLEFSGVKLSLQLNSGLPPAAVNGFDLRQTINNILTNAIQSIPSGGGGTIGVRTSLPKQQKMIKIDCRDDGVGIPKEHLPKVFDPFFTTKPRGLERSSGLGLYIVSSIIKAYKGEITIKSDHRKGTTVTILLPIHPVSDK
jgi:PAS domain S-box-containing protein